MIRGLYLGSDGEEAAQKLLGVYNLSSSFQPCLVTSPYAGALAEARRRLAEAADRLINLEPDAELWPRLETSVEETRGECRPVVWLQASRFDPDAWGPALASLQQRREDLRRAAPWMWILAGPPELVPLVHEKAMHVLTGVSVRVSFGEKPRKLPSASQPVRWLHLSDFHFKALERWDRRATLTSLLKHADKLREQGLAPDLVFITGDVAFSGKQAEYEQAKRFLSELAKRLRLEPRERFFLVPGNHDVDRTAIGAGDRRIVKSIETQNDVEDILADGEAMKLLGRRLNYFYKFTKSFLGQARRWHPERPWRVDVLQIHGLDVAILQLNSAWASGAGERRLLVGEAQVRQALQDADDAFLRIALVHHPLADLRDVDRERLEPLYAAGGIHFLLRGHLHRTHTEVTHGPDGTLVKLAAGAAYVHGNWPRTHLVTEADLAGGGARVHYFRYSAEAGLWAKDTLSYKNVPDGVWTLPLPAGLKLDTDAPPAPAGLSEARLATLAARYRAAAGAVHGSARFAGLFGHHRPFVRLSELFVPLRLEEGRGKAEKPESWTTADLLRRLVPRKDHGPICRVVVLGAPGSGKTTLCRFVATVIAGEVTVDGVDVPGGLLPLFLPLPEAVREGPGRSLVDLLADQARTRLQVALPDGFLEQALEGGLAVLVLDGLDEVGSPAEREGLRERLQAFCRLYPNVPVLLTSRVAGYEEAPLPRAGPGAFNHLSLAPFSNDDLERFVSLWYAVKEPADPQARDRCIADLTAALATGSQVRELARNPMLATLIALVHRFEAHLPKNRAALYDLCVKTLLETWPRAWRKTFKKIDTGLQRAYLEALASRMQKARTEKRRTDAKTPTDDDEMPTDEDGNLIERRHLVETLSDVRRSRGDGAETPEETRGLVERWVDFLEQVAGLVVEQRPGWFSFFHLSFMEYLAAAALESEAESPLEEVIADNYDDPWWEEVCLLVVGIRATKKRFLDRLFRLLREKADGYSFMLRCLREEAAFDPQQRAEIVRGASRSFLERDHRFSFVGYEEGALWDLLRSRRHGEWTGQWINEELSTARGQALQALVAILGPSRTLVLEEIRQRADAGEVAADLLELWPGSKIGTWAQATASSAKLLEWSLDTPGELLALRAAASLASYPRPASGLAVGLVQSAGRIVALATESKLSASERMGTEGRVFPAAVKVDPGSLVLRSRPRWPADVHLEAGDYSAQGFIRGIVPRFVASPIKRRNEDGSWVVPHWKNYRARPPRSAVLSLEELDWDSPGEDLDRLYQREYFQRLCQYVRGIYASDLGQHFAYVNRKRSGSKGMGLGMWYPSRATLDRFNESFVQECALEALGPGSDELHHPAPDRGERSTDGDAWMRARHPGEESALIRDISIGSARLVAEAWIATVTTLDASRADQLAYVHRRVQNAWLLQSWSLIDELWQDRADQDLTALYLALGFSQATTTWQWPATECWVNLTATDPPRHWLPRSQWHLCWLLHDPGDAGHRQAFVAALDEGRSDTERPGVAATLRELFNSET